MDDSVAVFGMIAVPLLIWAGVFAFMLGVDRRVRDLERRVRETGNFREQEERHP